MATTPNWFDYQGNRHPIREWAYLAGLLDGEGCIRIMGTTQGRTIRALCVSITNKDTRMIEWLREQFDGVPRRRANGVWDVQWNCRRAKPILLNTLPFLLVKKEQAELGLSFIKLMGRKSSKLGKNRIQRITPENRAARLAIREAMSILKGHKVKEEVN